ncbi:muts domain V-domain-containing protein, partial [Syncephalis pseudoplumigaleata]
WTQLGFAIDEAQQAVLQAERVILDETIKEVLAESDALIASSQVMAQIDVAAALAVAARELEFVRPTLTESGTDIESGRHPVVEHNLIEQGRQFTANHCRFDDEAHRLWLITGPNMGGKSTFLRQNALIVLLAQMGSFVPATRASVGIVDRIFTRVG